MAGSSDAALSMVVTGSCGIATHVGTWRGLLTATGMLLAVAACGPSQQASTGAATPPPTSPPGAGPSHVEPGQAPPRIVLRWESRTEGQVLVVENHGDATVDLATDVAVATGTAFSLRDDCAKTPPDCRPLAPGAALTPPPFRDGQCNDARPTAAPGPTATVSTCDGAYKFTTAP